LIGLINLGSRLSEQDYSSDDHKLLTDLATQAAPALRVAQLVRQQQPPVPSQPVEFEIPSAPGNERLAMQQVAEIVQDAGLPAGRLEKLKTAVAEATMNALEHGNKYDPDKPARLKVFVEENSVRITITDEGGGAQVETAVTPDLEAKLAGEQSPRGWGLFLIQNMVDEMRVHQDDHHHTIELVMHLADQQGK
jgi:anti-sigma regulatory factor (Ser/Thr protein kinase)